MKGTKVILNEDVYNLGEEGDVCVVAPGYARNYLLPKNLAVPYTKENISSFESRRAAIEKRKEEKRKRAQTLRERLDGLAVVLPMNAGDTGKLFGSVTNGMIQEALQKEGIEIDKKKIDVQSNAMKMVGDYTVNVRLYEGEEAELKIRVVNQNRDNTPSTAEVKSVEELEETAAPKAQGGKSEAEKAAEAVAAEPAPGSEAAESGNEADPEASTATETAETGESEEKPGSGA
jgi:large subunit ribosomal protein L9